MKKQLAFLGAAAAALMMAGTAHADGGYVGLSYADNSDSDSNAWGVDGAFASSNFQFDAGYSRINTSVGDANDWGIGAHLFSRNDQWLWGGYVGYNSVDGGGDSVNEWTVALQTQFYMPRTTLSGDLSYSQISDFPFLGDITTTQIDGEARFFATDNFSFQGNLGWGNMDTDIGSGDFWTYGVGAEWQADSMPISLFADWQGVNSDAADTSSTWRIGVRYNWGGTLLERNRSGAGLNQPGGILRAIF